jgi:hypothetical protein
MSIVATGMTAYVKQEGLPLVVKAVTEGKTTSMANIISGLKGSADVPFLASTLNLVKGHNCNMSDTGNSVFTPVRVDVNEVSYFESICTPAQLENKALMYEISNASDVPFAEAFLNEKAQLMSKAIDKLVWLGEKPTDAVNGFLKMAADASLLSTITGATSTVTAGVDALIDAAITADSTFENSDSVVVFLNYAKYRTYVKELVAANYFHYNAETMKGSEGIVHPGTKIMVVPTEGLAGHNFGYLADTLHLHVGTNLLSETEGIQVIYEEKSRIIYLRADFYLGTGVSKTIFKKAI